MGDLRSDPLLPLLALAGAMLVSASLVAPVRQLLETVPVGALAWLVAGPSGVAAMAVTRVLGVRSV
ncbi:hypothetical protein ASG91_01560 [Phycicoccus sp. Soil802]|nr:hypothetical protein [Phycicoccus sp. Soil802]KRF29718.1 hypothetical protein ASG91_01560 [Phycicoccus sp. Soil802]